MNREAWWAAVHGITKSQTRLSNFIFTFHFHALEKEMATHSSVLAWRIPGMGEPDRLLVYGVAQSQTRLKRLSSSSMRCYLSLSLLSVVFLPFEVNILDHLHDKYYTYEYYYEIKVTNLTEVPC